MMTSARMADLPGRRLPSSDDDRGSLAMALLAILVAGMLGGLMLPMVISQNKSTRFDITRVHALHAAQTGVDVALGRIQTSTTTDADGYVWGDPAKLPCFPDDKPLTGTANGTGNGNLLGVRHLLGEHAGWPRSDDLFVRLRHI